MNALIPLSVAAIFAASPYLLSGRILEDFSKSVTPAIEALRDNFDVRLRLIKIYSNDDFANLSAPNLLTKYPQVQSFIDDLVEIAETLCKVRLYAYETNRYLSFSPLGPEVSRGAFGLTDGMMTLPQIRECIFGDVEFVDWTVLNGLVALSRRYRSALHAFMESPLTRLADNMKLMIDTNKCLRDYLEMIRRDHPEIKGNITADEETYLALLDNFAEIMRDRRGPRCE